MGKVEIQKGKIMSNPPTMKSMTREQVDREDMEMHKLRKSGQTLDLKSPRKLKEGR
jgi:hypothetical protein